MITINPAILNSQFGTFTYLRFVITVTELDSLVRVQASISVAVDVARHVKSTTPSTFTWSKKTT